MGEEKAYHHGDLKHELIKSAFLLLDEKGVDSVGIREVARRVGVSHAAPAKHFKNKQALLTEMAIEVFIELRTQVQHVLQRDDSSLRSQIHRFAGVVLDYGLAHPNRYKLVCRQECLDQKNSRLKTVMDSLYQELFSILEKTEKHIDIKSQAVALWSLIHGYVLFRVDGALIAATDQVTGLDRQVAIIDVILDGLD